MENINLVTRNGLTWLLIAQALSIFPLSFYLPWWVLGLWLGCALWRVQIYKMKFNYPTKFVKFCLVIIIGIGVYYSRGTILGLDGGIVLLVSAFSLKLIELKNKRDALVIIYIGFLVITALYLYDNSFIWVIYSLFPVTTLLAALIGLNQTKQTTQLMETIKLACFLLLQAIPLMLILFFMFPRLEPLWTLPTPGKQQSTGISNKMTPGELANLAQSSELVFRANFTGNIPPKNKLYWRALTLESYNGRSWQQVWDAIHIDNTTTGPDWREDPANPTSVTYNIIMQPNFQTWVVALDTVKTLPNRVTRSVDFHLQRLTPIDTIYSYQITSSLNALREPDKSRRINFNKQLPSFSDPRAKAFGEKLKETYQGDTSKIVKALLRQFHDNDYFYTLQTPDLGADSVDKFFFDTKRGFCEHYASATAFILRAANIPARIVLGYQGGELNTAGNFLQIRQFDAHAWVEYWEQGKGWISIDPTFQVAPSRIELGLRDALNIMDQQQLDNNPLLGYGSTSVFAKLRMTWENFNNNWDIFIASYNSDQQRGLLKHLLGVTNFIYLGVLLILSAFIVIGIWLLWIFKPWKREKDPVLRCYEQFEDLLADQGINRAIGESPISFANRAAKTLPLHAHNIYLFNKLFIAEYYEQKNTLSALQKALAQLRKALS